MLAFCAKCVKLQFDLVKKIKLAGIGQESAGFIKDARRQGVRTYIPLTVTHEGKLLAGIGLIFVKGKTVNYSICQKDIYYRH